MKLPREVEIQEAAPIRQPHYLETEEPAHHRIAVPDHAFLRVGTFNSILRAVADHKGVTREAIIATL
jgi:hypothetical protein